MSTNWLKAIFPLSQAADGFRYAHILQFFQQGRRRRSRNAQKYGNVAAPEYGFKSVFRKHFPYMVRSFGRSTCRFQDIAIGKRAVNVLFRISNVLFLNHFTDVEIPIVQLVPLAQQEIPEKQFQILRRLMDAAFEIVVVGANEGISEIPGVLRKNVVGHIEAYSSA